MAEIAVATDLMGIGYDVFQNFTRTGPADIVVMNPDTMKCLPVDVKAAADYYYREDGEKTIPMRTKMGLHDGVWCIGYMISSREVLYPEGFFESLNN